MGRPSTVSSSVVFGLLVAVTACSLTKKQDDASASATAAVALPPAPVFNVATPQPVGDVGTTAPAAPHPAEVAAGKVTGRAAAGGATGTSRATGTVAIASGAGGATVGQSAAAAAAGGAPAATPTVPAVRLPDQACIAACAGQAQTCIVAAGIDPAKLTTCHQAATACPQTCYR